MTKNPHHYATGPRTPEGKAVSCMNRLSHGLTGQFRVLPSESQEEFDEAHQALIDEHRPQTATECELVRRMAEHAWQCRRAQVLLDGAILQDDLKRMALFLRYQTTNDRAFYKALNDLLRFRREQRLTRKFESQIQSKPRMAKPANPPVEHPQPAKVSVAVHRAAPEQPFTL